MIRKVLAAIILVPLVILLLMFAVANREIVTVSFDPFSSMQPAYAASMPLFVLIFVLVVLGVLLGGTAAWLGQGKWRRSARRLDEQMRRLSDELHELRRSGARSEPPPLGIPPPPL